MHELAEQLCDIGRRAYARGLVSSSEGNFSCLLPDDRVLCTPSGLCKGRLTPADLCVVNLAGQKLSGARPHSSEILLHLAVYRATTAARSRARAVVHTHPPYATVFALLNEPLPTGYLPEAEIFLGDVPLIPYVTPGTPALGEALALFACRHVAALLANHGAVTWGADLEQAYLRTETLEAVARTCYLARQLGAPIRLPPGESGKLRRLYTGGG